MKTNIILIFLFFIFSCTGNLNSKADNKNQYIDTFEELQEISPHFNNRKNAIFKLPKNQQVDSLTNYICEVLEKMNLDLFADDTETIIDGFFGKDSTAYSVLLELHRPTAYLLMANNQGRYSKDKIMKIDKILKKKCPETYAKYLIMEEKHMEVLIGMGPRIGNR